MIRTGDKHQVVVWYVHKYTKNTLTVSALEPFAGVRVIRVSPAGCGASSPDPSLTGVPVSMACGAIRWISPWCPE